MAEQSEDGEGLSGPHGGPERKRKPFSVTCGDNSPRGRAKGGQSRPPLQPLTAPTAFIVRGVGDAAPYEVFTDSQCVGAGVLDGPCVICAAGHTGPALREYGKAL